MQSLLLILAVNLGLAVPGESRMDASEPMVAAVQETPLYRVTMYRAAPGRLLDLIERVRATMTRFEENSGYSGYLMRHSQGDHWDLMWLRPLPPESMEAPGELSRLFEPEWDELVAWMEVVWMRGPAIPENHAVLADAGLYHIEMFVGLPGKRQELLEQRRMENVYLREIGRAENLIFWRVDGAGWDAMTIGGYRGIKHFAESADIPDDVQERAALKAGFEGADYIGTYLRSLIARHNDTLAGAVR